MAGRPSHKLELSLTNPLRSIQQIKIFCENSENVRSKVREFADELLLLTVSTTSKETQTENSVQNIFELTENLTSYEKSFLVSNIWNSLHQDFQVKLLFLLYSDFDEVQQTEMFALLGDSLNKTLFKESQKSYSAQNLDLKVLKDKNKSDFYNNCDKRLTNFFDALTAKSRETRRDDNDNVNFKYNAYRPFS